MNSHPVFLSVAFRPLFLLTGLYGLISIAWWSSVYTTGRLFPPTFVDPVSWHGHEMIFGFAAAAVGGFLLTAVANWTQRPPVSGIRLSVLAVAWILGRIALNTSDLIGLAPTLIADMCYPVFLTVLFGNEVFRGRDRRNIKTVLMLILLCLLNLSFHLEASFTLPIPPRLSIRGSLMVMLLLIGIIAGRIIPNFTKNWLIKNRPDIQKLPKPFDKTDAIVMILTGLFAAVWTISPFKAYVAAGGLVVAGLHFFRLIRWKGAATFKNPLLFVLHVGYFWISIGLALTAWSVMTEDLMFSAALHGLGIGVIGLMVMAVGSRVALGHTGRELKAGKAMTISYALIIVSTVFRISAGWPEYHVEFLMVSAFFWSLAMIIFLIRYYPILTRPPRQQSLI